MSSSNLQLSVIMATHNREAVVEQTLRTLAGHQSQGPDFEIIVVDNDSGDRTAEIADHWADRVIRLDMNEGSCAKAHGLELARGEFVVFLDDDSCPRAECLGRMLQYFQNDSRLGALGFRVLLSGGKPEGAALPGVSVGCGAGFRAEALRQAGGIDKSFFMQAEEYDWSFRLVNAGWRIQVKDDLVVDHRKTACARVPARTLYYDVRNNIRIAARYLPENYLRIYEADWLDRYQRMAKRNGLGTAFEVGQRDGFKLARDDRVAFAKRRLSPHALEFFFRWHAAESWARNAVASGISRIIFAGLGKNIYAFHRAMREAGIEVVAIGDDLFCGDGQYYRGVPIVPLKDAASRSVDAVVVANMACVHAHAMLQECGGLFQQPTYFWMHCGDDYGFGVWRDGAAIPTPAGVGRALFSSV